MESPHTTILFFTACDLLLKAWQAATQTNSCHHRIGRLSSLMCSAGHAAHMACAPLTCLSILPSICLLRPSWSSQRSSPVGQQQQQFEGGLRGTTLRQLCGGDQIQRLVSKSHAIIKRIVLTKSCHPPRIFLFQYCKTWYHSVMKLL